jgi:hypothetical protein
MSEEVLATSTNVVTIGAVEVTMSVDAGDPTTMTGTYTVPPNLTTSALSVESFTIGTVADIYGTTMTSTTVPTSDNALSASAIAVDTAPPETTISGVTYNPGTNVITITGSNFDDLASGLQANSDVSGNLNWDQFTWDINNDGSTTADVTFDASTDLTSAVYTSATQLTVTLNSTGETKLESASDFAALGGTDRVDVAAGFTSDSAGNASATDDVTAAAITYVNADGAPTLDSFTVQNANGDAISSTTVGLAQELTIVAQMSEEVLATSTFTLTLSSGASVNMNIYSGSDPDVISGTFIPASTDNMDVLRASSFTVGSVADIYGTAMTSATLPTGSNALTALAIEVDVIPIAFLGSPSYSDGTLTLRFSEAVQNKDDILAAINLDAQYDVQSISWNSDNDVLTVGVGSENTLSGEQLVIANLLDVAGNSSDLTYSITI